MYNVSMMDEDQLGFAREFTENDASAVLGARVGAKFTLSFANGSRNEANQIELTLTIQGSNRMIYLNYKSLCRQLGGA